MQTPHTAGLEGRDGAMSTDPYRTLTDGSALDSFPRGTAQARLRDDGIEGQSSLFGGTHI